MTVVTVSIRRMSLGSGFVYLMNSVARGDGAVAGSSPLTRYYAESGTPPGRFLGSGLAGLDGGRGVPAGSVVSEEALWRMLGMMADPVTGEPLGRRPQHWPTPLTQRIAARVAALPSALGEADRAAAVAEIEAEERRREASIARPVAAFDLTFSVPKSVSAVWALADAETQAVIYRAHQDAIDLALGWAERNVIFTRTGAGGAVQEEVRGLVAAAFDHWDSRAGDPHLHRHVVIANRVQTTDGTWRSLDGATLFRYTVALSELHEGVLQDLLTDRLGVGWAERARQHSPVPRHDIAGVPEALLEEFSTRSRNIAKAKDDLVAEFAQAHGRQPSNVEVLKLRQQATLATRPDKQHHTLAERMNTWRQRARRHLGRDPTGWTRDLLHRTDLPALTSASVDERMLTGVAAIALDTVAQKRATFGHANVLAEVHRQLHGARFATPHDRLTVADRTTRLALDEALPLDPVEAAPVPEHLRRADGSSKLRHHGAARFSTRTIFDAETRLLDAARTHTAPTANPAEGAGRLSGPSLGADQADAVAAICTSGRVLDLLVGAAGTGKTTSLAALKTAWEATHGHGSVVGLAPSATAAQVLGDELGVAAENTAKWLLERARSPDRDHRITDLRIQLFACTSYGSALARRLQHAVHAAEAERDRWTLQPDQLVIIDEAGLAGTIALDQIVTVAQDAGAKVLLVGDWAQHGAIQAGGAFAMLAHDRPDTPTLTDIRRFTHDWEADATARLRTGDETVIDTYLQHDRVRSGDHRAMLDALFTAWKTDVDRGLDSAMIATDDDTVAELNALAQAHRRDTGDVEPGAADAADGNRLGVGDCIITRRNDRRLTTAPGSWVKNGDTWTITTIDRDGTLHATSSEGPRSVRLPAGYVAAHVELGYATTTYRAQGRTHDTAHALIDSSATREGLYVAATRARQTNTLYVDTAGDPDPDPSHGEIDTRTAEQTLAAVLRRSANEASAHAALKQSGTTLETLEGVPTLARLPRTYNPPDLQPPTYAAPEIELT